ncbi:MAG: hypothetical protein JOZ07_17595 [Solirubrobacterales bacterium]|nr:hypothetical protein [Solirubrobacterales bacterium]
MKLRRPRQFARASGGDSTSSPDTDPTVFSFTNPLATPAVSNPVVQPFKLGFSYSQVHTGLLRLKALLIRPVSGADRLKGGCAHCDTGHGHFANYRLKGDIVTEPTVGKLYIDGSTRIAQAVVRPGAIGRFKLYGVRVGPPTVPVPLTQGCLPADLIPTEGPTPAVVLNALLEPKVLPRLPCSGTVNGDRAVLYTPYELSPAAPTPVGKFTGHANGSRYISVFQVTNGCSHDALAESYRTHNFIVWHVRGDFTKYFSTAPATKPGFFCGYLQSGGHFGKIPDGRVGLAFDLRYYAGDAVSVSPASGTSGSPVTDVITGNASTSETLWYFDSYSACAPTAQQEYPNAVGLGHSPVSGAFSVTVTGVTLSQSAYRCAYLQLGGPNSNGQPTGPTLAGGDSVITIS